jgi:ribosomal-protein-alanine N-acetyltransferase
VKKKARTVKLLPIELESYLNLNYHRDSECLEILKVYPDYYELVGFTKPWIGYFATIDGDQIVGCGGFKGSPREGKVEIAYGTFKNFEGQGIGTAICRQLVLLALETDSSIRITARALIENNVSASILKRN